MHRTVGLNCLAGLLVLCVTASFVQAAPKAPVEKKVVRRLDGVPDFLASSPNAHAKVARFDDYRAAVVGFEVGFALPTGAVSAPPSSPQAPRKPKLLSVFQTILERGE